MAKTIITIWMIIIFSISNAQSLMVDKNINLKGSIGNNIEGVISITNTEDRPIQIEIKRTDLVIGSSQKSWFCWDEECYDESQSELPVSKKINPGQTLKSFRAFLASGITEGYSTVKYLIYEKGNPSNEVEIEVNYTVENATGAAALFSSEDVVIQDIYPNPITEFAIIDYKINNPQKEVKIVIHSVLGSVITEYNLQPFDTSIKMKIDAYNPGVYFYTLYVDNEGLMTRKMIIQH